MHSMIKIDPQKTALLLIEFQQEWLSEQGKLRYRFQDQEQYLSSIVQAKTVLSATRKTAMPVLHSGLQYSANYKELGKANYGLRAVINTRQTFLAGTTGSQFAADFKPLDSEFVIAGRTGASAFAGSNLDSYLRNNQINTLFIMGYALHVCVESTLRAAHDLGYTTIIIEDACAAFTQQQKTYVLEEIIHHFGARITTNEYLAALNHEVK